ncbi:MAG: hypothetical protein ACYC69_02695 [Thermodesulfovibrionales bacterium]
MGQSVTKWVRDKVREYKVRDAKSFLASYHSISRDLYIDFGDPCDGYSLDACERERNLIRRIQEIAVWRSAETTGRHGQMYLFTSTAPSPSKDDLFLDRVWRETDARGVSDIARLAAAVEKGDWEWIVGRIWSYRRSTVADNLRTESSVIVGDLPVYPDENGDKSSDDEDVVDIAERFIHCNKYYEFCRDELSRVDDRLDAEKIYFRNRTLFNQYDLDKNDAIRLIGYAQSLAEAKCCRVEDVLEDDRFLVFLRQVQMSFAAEPALVAA